MLVAFAVYFNVNASKLKVYYKLINVILKATNYYNFKEFWIVNVVTSVITTVFRYQYRAKLFANDKITKNLDALSNPDA